MKFDVLVTPRAEAALRELTDWIAERSHESAERWYDGFVKTLLELGANPYRWPVARESKTFPFEVREMLYGRKRNYRALYTIRENLVLVVAIRHAAQRDLKVDDL
jgi:plasmid stabilization system protein ParE